MHLFKSVIVSTLAAYATAASISAQQTVDNVNGITTLSSDLNDKVRGVTVFNIFQTGPDVVNGFGGIIKQATKDYQAMIGKSSKRDADTGIAGRILTPRAPPFTYTPAEQQLVCDAFIGFVKVHQALLATVIGKHGIIELTLFAYPVAAALRGVEGVVDEIAFTLIAQVPSCAAAANAAKKNLDNTLAESIKTYSQGFP